MSDQAAPGQPITIQIAHDGLNTTSYELLIDGEVTESKPFDSAGVAFQLPEGLPAGSYEIQVKAIGPAGEATSDPVTLIVIPPVGDAPTKPRVVIVIG
jgi:hypothetical protein